ncbi:MAG: ADP-ribosylglycohydrolase family protein, partial [Actinomycetota bacterium]|nr:ADP-ribosylglycohydrolase family protein [Actinomycetota bacterium]
MTTAVELDRAAGALLGTACGDALGAGYEFGSAPLPPPGVATAMIGGGLGGFAPGEWTDDTAMAVCVAEVAATGADLRTEAALDRVAEGFARWFAGGPADVGVQTRGVLSAGSATAAGQRRAAAALHRRTGRTAGNGSLMRTAAVALAHLGDDEALRDAATAVSELTHSDPLAGEACVLWCIGIDRAVRLGTFDGVREGLAQLPAGSRDRWAAWLSAAEAAPPDRFAPNGFVVPALQAAWSAVIRTAVPSDDPEQASFGCLHLQHSLQAAVRAGDDTDTVAAIAGALLGARWGASAVPARWRRLLHGWPGLR